MKNQSLHWTTKIDFALQIARGLDYLHERNIVHRDLKSFNVLVSKDNKLKLCDFGLAKVKLHSTTNNANTVGSVPWHAPELFEINAVHKKQTDIYALGVLFWEIATHQLPWKSANSQANIIFCCSNGAQRSDSSTHPSSIQSTY